MTTIKALKVGICYIVPPNTYHSIYAKKEFIHVRPIDHLKEGDLFIVTGVSSEHPSSFYVNPSEHNEGSSLLQLFSAPDQLLMSTSEFENFRPTELTTIHDNNNNS